MSYRPMIFLLCIGMVGCNTVWNDIKDVFDGPEDYASVDIYEVVCPNAFVDFTLALNMEDVTACFGSPTEPEFAAALNAALDGEYTVSGASECDPSANPFTCTLAFNETVEVTAAVRCEGCDWSEDVDISTCCDYTTDGWSLIESAQESAEQLLQEACPNLSLNALTVQDPGPANTEPPFDQAYLQQCDQSTYVVTDANADYNVSIDPTVSYIAITRPNSSLFSAVTGAGTAATQPGRFLSAVAWADDASLDGIDYENWRFGLKQPLVVTNNSGAFTITPADSPLLVGRGDIDGVDSYARIGLNARATGTMDLTNMVWELDYTETAAGGGSTLAIHFEGVVSTP